MPFIKPPLDGSLSLPEIFDFHWLHNPTHPLFQYERTDGSGEIATITWAHAVKAVHTAAAYIERICASLEHPFPKGAPIAILGNLDCFSYFGLVAGVMRAGFQAFPMSPRNPIPVTLHLLNQTGIRHILVSSDPGIQRLVANLAAAPPTPPHSPIESPTSSQPALQFIPLPTFEYLYNGYDDSFEPSMPVPHAPDHAPALIMHSTGTMAMPKPIRMSTTDIVNLSLSLNREADFSNSVWSCHSVPSYYAMTIVLTVWTMAAGITLSSFSPESLHVSPSPDRVLASACASGSDTLICVPYYLESWSRSPQHLQTLQSLKRVIYAGAPLHAETGDYLSAQGVRLSPVYGATEFGIPLQISPEPTGSKEDWEYFEFSPHFHIELLPSHNDVYHLVLLNENMKRSPMLNFEVKGVRMYNTLDLVQQHPTKPHLWRVYGRSDEQLTHSTGEKTNPIPIELRLKKHPKIKHAIVFGHGRCLPGVLVEVAPEWTVDPCNRQETEKLRNEIWFYMDQINEFSPVHSRVVKEMMLLADPGRPFEINHKGLVRKGVSLVGYEGEIEEAYEAVQLGFPPELPSPEAWELEECIDLIRMIVHNVIGHPLEDDEDLVSFGSNSMEIVRIRATILNALHHGAKVSCRRIPPNFVYANPTIRALGEYVMKIVLQGHGLVPGGLLSDRIVEVERMVRKYTANPASRVPRRQRIKPRSRVEGNVVLLTGSTGALGAHILERLEKDPLVTRIYALNRPCRKGDSAAAAAGAGWSHRTGAARHEDVFQSYALDSVVLISEKVIWVEGDLADENLGLGRSFYTKLQAEVNYIIHAAWSGNPNARVTSLEPLIAGTRNLLDFAIGSRLPSLPRFVFLSSMCIFYNWVGGPRSPESANTRPASALGGGYGESKWVAERVVDQISDESTLPSIIIRVGHLCGGRNGAWNSRHWFPTLIRSSQVIKCLPRPQGDITWIPIHHAAASIVEIAMRNPTFTTTNDTGATHDNRYYNLSHPTPVTVLSVFSILSHHLDLELVDYETWLAALHATRTNEDAADVAVEAIAHNPALNLFDFFRALYKPVKPWSKDKEAFGFPLAVSERAVAAAPQTLAVLPEVTERDVISWLRYWHSIRFLL